MKDKVETHVEEVLEALEPWLVQLLRWNPASHDAGPYLEKARRQSAKKLAKIIEESES